MEITIEDIKKIINHEEARLQTLAQQQADPMKDENIAGYIVGVCQLSANLQILFGNRESAQDEPVCWKCGCVLETKKGLDYQKEPVDICCECGAFIR